MNIQGINTNPQVGAFVGLPAGTPVGPTASNAGPASARVTNFAQNMAADGAALKGIGANAIGGLFGQGGNGSPPMMAPQSQGDSGYDIDRAVALTRQKIGAGKTTGDDLFAAQLAAVGED